MANQADPTVVHIQGLLDRSNRDSKDTAARTALINAILERAWPRLQVQARKLLISDFPRLRGWVETGGLMSELEARLRRELERLLTEEGSLSAAEWLTRAGGKARWILLEFVRQRRMADERFLPIDQPGTGGQDGACAAEPAWCGPTPTQDAVRNERARRLRELIDTLPEKPREVLDLYYYAGMDLGEIAALLDIEEGAAKKRLQRARRELGRTLAATGSSGSPSDIGE